MKVFRESSLGCKIVLAMMAISSASLLIACLSFLGYDVLTFRQSVADHLNVLADITGANVAAALTDHDPASASRVLRALHAEPHIQAARVYLFDGTAFASYLRDSSLPGELLPARLPPSGMRLESEFVTDCQPIFFGQDVVGYVYLQSDLREMELRKHRLLLFVLILTAVSSIAAFFVAVLLKRVICAPILGLVETSKRVSRDKDYGIRARGHANDELGLLVDGFNEMLEEIEKRETSLKSEVSYRARAEQTMRESEEQLQLLLDSTAEAIYGVNLHGVCSFTNPACLRLLGYERSADLLGKVMHNLIHHSRPDGTPYPLAECPSYLTMKSGLQGHTDHDILWRAD